MASRLSTAYVLEKLDVSPQKGETLFAYRIMEKAESGTDAQSKCLKIAESNPGRIFAAACIWPPVMAKEIRKVTFVNPEEDEDAELNLTDDQGLEDENLTEVKETPKTEVKEVPKAEVKETPKAEVKETPKAEVNETPKAEVKKTPKTEVKEVPKAEVKETPKVEDKGYTDLFGNAEVEDTPGSFVNEDPIEADSDDESNDLGGLF